jgi:MFS family permease
MGSVGRREDDRPRATRDNKTCGTDRSVRSVSPADRGQGVTTESPDDRVSGKAWLTLAILLLLLVVAYLDRQILSLLVQPIRKDLHIDDVQVSLLIGMSFALFYAVFSLPLGWLADRTSRKGVIYVCITGWSLATTACGLAHSFLQFAVARFGVGIGEGGLSPAAYRMIAAQFPRRRLAFALGIFGAGASIGGPLALIVGGQVVKAATAAGGAVLPLIGAVKPWQLVFLVIGPPGLILAPLIFLAPKEPARVQAELTGADKAEFDKGYFAFLRSRWKYLTLHFSGFALITLVSYGMGAWNVVYFQRRFGMPVDQITLVMGPISAIFGLTGFIGGGWVADRWFATGVKDAHMRYFAYGLPVVVVCAVAAYALADRPLFAFIPLALVNLLMPFTGPAVGHLQLCTPAHYRGRTAALFTMVFNIIGMVLGPTVVALLTENVFRDPAKVGWSLATTFGVAGGGAIVVFFLLLKPAREAVLEA